MSTVISYGKSHVVFFRLGGDGVAPLAAAVDVDVFGERFISAYTKGDNREVVATDTMKNFVYAMAAEYTGRTLLGLCAFFGRKLLATYPVMEALQVSAREVPLDAASGERGPSDVLFRLTRGDVAVAEVSLQAGSSGPERVLVLADQPLAQVVALALNHGVYTTKAVTELSLAQLEMKAWRPHLLLVDLDLRPGSLILVGQRIANRRLPTIAFTARGACASSVPPRPYCDAHGADAVGQLCRACASVVLFARGQWDRTAGVCEDVLASAAAPHARAVGAGLLGLVHAMRGTARLARPHLLDSHLTATRIELTAMEQALLYLLASNPDRIIGREEILDALWGADYVVESNVVDRHIRNLRIKLRDSWRKPRYIGTVAGKGYRFLAKAS